MKRLNKLFFLAILSLLVGCQATAPTVKVDSAPFLHDEVFPGYQTKSIETEADIFTINKAAKAFVNKTLYRVDEPVSRIKTLISGIFSHAELHLLYQNDANTIANETFANRSANCLSLTIMTYAMADYADLHVIFQQVSIPEF